MITMPKVFSANALYLHSSILEIKGTAEVSATVKAEILKDGFAVSFAEAKADENGEFTVRINTPSASYDEYSIKVSTSESEYVINGVLFGELWLACGQSNMEMSNVSQPEWTTEMSERIKGKHMRFFSAPRLAHDAEYPIKPVSDTNGWWMSADDTDKVQHVSALATAFSNDLYDFFAARGEDMPVGFLNCSRGGTCIETWIPHEVFDRYPTISYKKPDLENWNAKGEGNYQQPGAHYNYNTAPHLGVKTRGMLWYQGETNLYAEQKLHVYKDLMIALRESYKELFAPTPDETFPMISSQIYPWRYIDGSESVVGYFNKCFSDLGKTDPEHYPYVPLCDLSPIWTYHTFNHPIHPAHKYALGSRFAILCLNKYYGREGRYIQKMPPTLKSCVRHGDKLRLTFEDVGSGLYINGKNVKGMYIRSKNGAYTPAKCEIVAKNVMLVYHPYIDKPVHCAYAVSSYETATNLMAGEFAVAPFCTEFDNPVTNVNISLKPWLDTENDGELMFCAPFNDNKRDVFVQPTFRPSNGSYVCRDKVYTLSGTSVRICGDGNVYGAYIKAEQYVTLDFGNYEAIKVSVYNSDQNDARLVLYYKEENGKRITYTVKGEVEKKLHYGWAVRTFDLKEIPAGVIEKAEFSFIHTAGKVPFVNLDNFELVPKN